MFYSHSERFAAKRMQAIHKYLQAAGAPAGCAVQIEISNNSAVLTGL